MEAFPGSGGRWWGVVSRTRGVIVLVEADALPKKEPGAHYTMEELKPLIDSGRARSFDRDTVHQLLEVIEKSALNPQPLPPG